MNTEPYSLMTDCGCELFSNDRKMKYVVRRNDCVSGGVRHTVYVAHCFIKDGNGWQLTSASVNAPSVGSFLSLLEPAGDFSIGIAELKNDVP